MDALTTRETKALARCEQTIHRGLSTFCDVGRALLEIRDGRLYRDSHATFEAYCSERWEFSRQRAYQLIGAAQTVDAMSTRVDTPPTTERQIRPLLTVPEDQRADVWCEVVETAPVEDGRPVITTKHVEETVQRWRGEPEEDVVPKQISVPTAELVVCRGCGHTVVLDEDGDCPDCLEPHAPAVEQGTPLEESPEWIGQVERLAREAIGVEGRPAVAERLQRLATQILMG